MARPLKSTWVDTGVPDDSTTLFRGIDPPTPILAVGIDDVEDEELLITGDATTAPYQGLIVLGDEMIAYFERFGTDSFRQLQRGYGGTTPVAHLAAADLEIHPLFYFPDALQVTIIALQERANTLQTEVDALTARVENLEADSITHTTALSDLETRVTALEGA